MEIDEEGLERIWRALTTRIDTINERTKNHTIEIRSLKKALLDTNKAVKIILKALKE